MSEYLSMNGNDGCPVLCVWRQKERMWAEGVVLVWSDVYVVAVVAVTSD